MQPRVSIVLPYFNAENQLSDAIESILCQTFDEFELILVDTNSNDGSFRIANDFASRDPRVRIVEEPRQGIVFALNTGIDEAEGEYIALMDANDISFPNRIEKQVEYLDKHPEVGVLGTQIRLVATNDDPEQLEGFNQFISWSNRIITHGDIEVNRFIEPPLIHPTAMYRKELVNLYGGYKTGEFPEDYELWLRWIEKGVKMHKLPEVLFDWTGLPERLIRIDEKYADQAFFEVKSRYLIDWLKENNKFFPEVVVWGAGRKSRQRFFILHELGAQAKFYIDLRANPERKVIQYQHTPPAGRNFIISYVANRAAREKIRMFLVELGYIEGKDFLCVA
jgi:glycosyltransferase involved in cell wall biosynthesis